MYLRLLLFGCFLIYVAAFDAENAKIDVQINESNATITIPKYPDVKSVFLSTSLSDQCAAKYGFGQSIKDSDLIGYTQDLNRIPTQTDQLIISIVVETNNEVIPKSLEFKIDPQGKAVKQTTSTPCQPVNLPAEDCGEEKPIFEENFTDSKLEKFEVGIYSTVNDGHHEFTTFVRQNTFVRDGKLHLIANMTNYTTKFQLENCSVPNDSNKCGPYSRNPKRSMPPIHTAKIQTKNTYSFKYGRYEITARMPEGDWLFPYILLQPKAAIDSHRRQEHILIAYARGERNLTDPSGLHIGGNRLFGSAFVHYNKKLHEETRVKRHTSEYGHFGNEFHNYTLIWQKDKITFKVDQEIYGTITEKKILDQLNKHHEYSLVLALTAGGILNYPDHQVVEGRFKVSTPKAISLFDESKKKGSGWAHPQLVISRLAVYPLGPKI